MVLPRLVTRMVTSMVLTSGEDLERLGSEILDATALRVISTIVHSLRTALRVRTAIIPIPISFVNLPRSTLTAEMPVSYALNESKSENVYARERES